MSGASFTREKQKLHFFNKYFNMTCSCLLPILFLLKFVSFTHLPRAIFTLQLLYLNLHIRQTSCLFYTFTHMAAIKLRTLLPYLSCSSLLAEPQHSLHTRPTMNFSRVANLFPVWLPTDFEKKKIQIKLEFKALQIPSVCCLEIIPSCVSKSLL